MSNFTSRLLVVFITLRFLYAPTSFAGAPKEEKINLAASACAEKLDEKSLSVNFTAMPKSEGDALFVSPKKRHEANSSDPLLITYQEYAARLLNDQKLEATPVVPCNIKIIMYNEKKVLLFYSDITNRLTYFIYFSVEDLQSVTSLTRFPFTEFPISLFTDPIWIPDLEMLFAKRFPISSDQNERFIVFKFDSDEHKFKNVENPFGDQLDKFDYLFLDRKGALIGAEGGSETAKYTRINYKRKP